MPEIVQTQMRQADLVGRPNQIRRQVSRPISSPSVSGKSNSSRPREASEVFFDFEDDRWR
jgi:hypothetical protein